MSLYGTMKTAVSGMNAQANLLSTVSDNIANANTTAYKRADTVFSSLVLPQTANGNYTSGRVDTTVRYAVTQQGATVATSSPTDMAIKGDGFFIVDDIAGQNTYLTRAGSFVQDANGNLVNAAGFKLMGYPWGSNPPAAVINGFTGLVPINLSTSAIQASATTTANLVVNLDSRAAVPTAPTAGANASNSVYTEKNSLVAFDSLGNRDLYDLYYTKTGTNQYEVAVYRHSNADPTSGAFPYSTGPLGTTTLNFDSTGHIDQATSTNPFNVVDTNVSPTQTFAMDLTGSTQLAYNFATGSVKVNGNAAAAIQSINIGKDGTVNAVFSDQSTKPIFQIPLATVQSPDNLRLLNGNVYTMTEDSGVVRTGFPDNGSFGALTSGALESSNVDMASELTDMISAQRSYTANSKVFQTGSDLMDVLIGLKR